MPYTGQVVGVPIGQLGLQSDVSQVLEPPQALMIANNISARYGFVEKAPGSSRWNASSLPASVLGAFDYWPDDQTQRVIAVCSNGRVYKFTSQYSYVEITPDPSYSGAVAVTLNQGVQGTNPVTLTPVAIPATLNATNQVFFVVGGNESAGRPRKLFIFTGNDPVQVISGDGSTRRNLNSQVTWTLGGHAGQPINLPTHALDWGPGNWPFAGLIYGGRLVAFGNSNNAHTLYESDPSDQENFVSDSLFLVPVYPGDGQKIIAVFNFKTRLTVVKYPYGLYYVDTSSAVYKLGSSFGGASPHCFAQGIDDAFIANATGSVTSLTAVFSLGNVEQGDVLKVLKAVKFMQENTSQTGTPDRHCLYYEDKKQMIFTYRSSAGASNDMMMIIDYHMDAPKVSWLTKDAPNCLALIKDQYGVPRPFYGSTDGYLYNMDSADRVVNGAAYTGEFRTSYFDFGGIVGSYNSRLSETNKIFDFLEVTFEPMGNWNLLADVWVDGNFIETVSFPMSGPSELDDGTLILDKSRLGGLEQLAVRRPLHCAGRRISVRFYNTTAYQSFKVSAMTFYFRASGQQQRN